MIVWLIDKSLTNVRQKTLSQVERVSLVHSGQTPSSNLSLPEYFVTIHNSVSTTTTTTTTSQNNVETTCYLEGDSDKRERWNDPFFPVLSTCRSINGI